MLVHYIIIDPSSSPNKRFEAFNSFSDDEPKDESAVLSELGIAGQDIFELGKIDLGEKCPDWAEDIRSQIHNEPDRVFAVKKDYDDDGGWFVYYFGLDSA